MYKVVIIDDEPLARKGIKNIVNWKSLNCEVCAEAGNGVEGLEQIRRYLPDIILTDIYIPGMEGLNMLKQAKNIVPDTKVIIVTRHRAFDLVHEAFKFGAYDFLLKPAKLEDLTSVIGRAAEDLTAQNMRELEFDKFKILFEQNIPSLKEKLLCDIIFNINNNEDEILEKMELFEMQINNFVFLLIENDFDENANTQYNKQLYQFGIKNSFAELLADKYEIYSIVLNSNRMCFIVQTNASCDIVMSEVVDKSSHLQNMINYAFGFSVTIAVSTIGTSVLDLPEKLKECEYSLQYKSYMENSSIIQYNDFRSFFKYEDYSLLKIYKQELLEGIKAGNEEAVKVSAGNISDFISLNTIDINYIKDFFYSTLSSINNIRVSVLAADADKRHEECKDIANLLNLIDSGADTEALSSLLQDTAINVCSKVNSYNNKSIRVILRKAVDYVNEHFAQPITLNEVACHTFVTTFYISRMFKKELGTSFVDYLNNMRIEKAKELLKDVKYKSYEVASLVGIPDPHYFSKLFKKHCGMTPSEYRETLNME